MLKGDLEGQGEGEKMGSVRALILLIALSCKKIFNSLADLKESELSRKDN